MSKPITTSSVKVKEGKRINYKTRKNINNLTKGWQELKKIGKDTRNIEFKTIGSERNINEIYKDGDWQGQRCFIIGGGPSLKGFDWSLLDGELTIGINKAIDKINPTILFSEDSRFFKWITSGQLGKKIKKKYEEYDGLKVWLNNGQHTFPEDIRLSDCAGNNVITNSFKEGIGHGTNSGFAALNLALNLGASPIYLLGFDMKGDGNKQTWWHDGYPEVQNESTYKNFVRSFESNAEKIKKRARVVNLNPDSNLRCFEFAKPELIRRTHKPLLVSCYTVDTPYEEEIKNLEFSLKKFGLDYDIRGVPSRGSWRENIYIKAEFMLQMLEEQDRDIVWLDSDGRMQKYPHWFIDFDADIGIHVIDWSKYPMSSREDEEYGNAVVYLSNNYKTKQFIKKWIKANDKVKHYDNGEEIIFGDVLKKMRKKQVNVKEFPASYSQIFDLMGSAGEPVIELWQASRRLKSKIGK